MIHFFDYEGFLVVLIFCFGIFGILSLLLGCNFNITDVCLNYKKFHGTIKNIEIMNRCVNNDDPIQFITNNFLRFENTSIINCLNYKKYIYETKNYYTNEICIYKSFYELDNFDVGDEIMLYKNKYFENCEDGERIQKLWFFGIILLSSFVLCCFVYFLRYFKNFDFKLKNLRYNKNT